MRKIHSVLLGIFAGGVLLGGIGTGVAFGEYSGMEYGGTVLIGEENLVTKDLDFAFTPEESVRICLNYCPWGDEGKDTLVVEDTSVPEGIVRYEVTYDSRELKPKLVSWEAEAEDETSEKSETESETRQEPAVTFVELHSIYQGNDFEQMMEIKDRILSDIRKGKLTSYESAGITDVVVRVNPKTTPYLEDKTK